MSNTHTPDLSGTEKQPFEKFEKLTGFIQELASFGHVHNWTGFLSELNEVCKLASAPSLGGPSIVGIQAIKDRIDYLVKAERKDLIDIDGVPVGSHARKVSWEFINELGYRKNELQDALKLLESPSPVQPDGWISVDTPPELVLGEIYSERVFAVCEGRLTIMAYCLIPDGEEDGYAWCNCYGDINGDPQFDDEYKPNLWRPIPKVPATPINPE